MRISIEMMELIEWKFRREQKAPNKKNQITCSNDWTFSFYVCETEILVHILYVIEFILVFCKWVYVCVRYIICVYYIWRLDINC